MAGISWTSKGRVVYDRKEHKFTYRDVARIVRKIAATQSFPPTFKEMGEIEDALRGIYHDYLSGLRSMGEFHRHMVGWQVIYGSMAFANSVLDAVPDWSPANVLLIWPKRTKGIGKTIREERKKIT